MTNSSIPASDVSVTSGQGEPLTVVIVGASGDLTRRLLFPALHRLISLGRLPRSLHIVGYAIEKWSTADLLAHLRDGVDQFGDGVDNLVWPEITANTTYVQGDLSAESIKALCALVHGPAVFYLALPPNLFGQAASALGEVGLANEDAGWRRLVIEKPFGTSLETAEQLQADLQAHWRENQLYRIDHFLGKESVQNLLVFRLANRFVEAVWNNANIVQVQITAAETIGLEGRWRYYDKAGALRDMVQNHLMQLFAICAMEPPSVWDSEVLREHKVEVLRCVRPFEAADITTRTVRGQYGAGPGNGNGSVAYRAEENIDATSNTETYAAVQFFVDNWRWQGVPFSIRSGKRMSGALTEIALELRDPPTRLFDSIGVPVDGAEGLRSSNWIVLRLRPDESIEIDAVAKKAGLGMTTERSVLSTTDANSGGSEYTAYEQLLIDVVEGDGAMFIRGDEAMESWRLMQPVLNAWSSGTPDLYPSGTDGPAPPPGFFVDGRSWRPVSG